MKRPDAHRRSVRRPSATVAAGRRARRLRRIAKATRRRSAQPALQTTRRVRSRSGFTLIELLIALTIFLILATVTIGAVQAFRSADEVSGSARQVQSYISGARDRAIYTTRSSEGPRPRGVRLLVNRDLLDQNGDPFACTTLQYVEGAGYFPPGANQRVQFNPFETVYLAGGGGSGTVAEMVPVSVDTNGDRVIAANERAGFGAGPFGTSTDYTATESAWASHALNRVFQAGLLGERLSRNLYQARVRLPKYANGSGRWYQALIVADADPTEPSERVQRTSGQGIGRVFLMTLAEDPNTYNASAEEDGYVFELRVVPLAGEDPRALPNGTAIDLRGAARAGALPASWTQNKTVGGTTVPVPAGPLDIMFDPSGLVTGSLAAGGLVHLPVVSLDDQDEGSNAGPYVPGEFLPLGYVGTDPDVDASYDTSGGTYVGPGKSGEELIVTVNTQTGSVTVAPVSLNDLDGDGMADDPLEFAETGLEAP